MLVEYWLWRYEDPITGQVCTTAAHMTASEASALPQARRVAGSVLFREIEPDLELKSSRRFTSERRSKRATASHLR
jgi:hypothetical protein